MVALDMSDPITNEHAPKILRELNNSFDAYLANQPSGPYVTSMRVLLMVIQSLLNKATRGSM